MLEVFVDVWDFPLAGPLPGEDFSPELGRVEMWGEHEFEDGVRFASTWVWFCLVVFVLFGVWWGLMSTRGFNPPSRGVVGVFVL